MDHERQKWWSPGLFAAAYNRMSRHGADGLAAGIAFGTLLSAAPLLLVVLAIAGQLLGDGAARDQVLDLVRDALGARPARLMAGWIDEVSAWSATATVLGIGFFVFGAGRLALLVDAALEVVFEVEHAPPLALVASLRAYVRLHLMSLAVTFAAGVLLLISLLVRAAAPWAFGDLSGSIRFWILSHVLSFGLVFGSVALAYRHLPPRRLTTKEVLEGALVTTVMLEIGFAIVRAIADWMDLGAAYGAAGAIIATLITMYLAAQIFLYGAEITAELWHRRRRGRPSTAGLPLPDEAPPPTATASIPEATRTNTERSAQHAHH